MEKYCFYYDETEHSRKINHKTISAENYYDNFIAVVVGWRSENEGEILKRYVVFEEKYANRKSNGELKSTTIKQSQLRNGFASLNNDNTCLLDEFLSLFDETTLIYFAVISKVEYLVLQLFENYQNSLYVNMDFVKYSIVKALLVYQPKEIIQGIFENTDEFISLLEGFFENRILQNKANPTLKQKETEAFGQILLLLDDIHTVKTVDWNYDTAFIGFNKYLNEKTIVNYSLIIDREGENGNTLEAASRVGIDDVTEEDSKNSFGIRMADMLAGLISKLLKALHSSLCYHSSDEHLRKKVLDKKWFEINAQQLNLYKKLYNVICVFNNAWYKAYAGTYSDDLIVFISFLGFMNHFESIKEINMSNIEMQGEYFSAYACECLSNYYDRINRKLPNEPIGSISSEFFLNQRGEKVYYEPDKQPLLTIKSERVCGVLSVGFGKNMIPMVTVAETSEIKCYRLPMGLSEWVMSLVALANMGKRKLPAQVSFTKTNDGYYADII